MYSKGQKSYQSAHPSGAKSSSKADKLDTKRGMGKKSHR